MGDYIVFVGTGISSDRSGVMPFIEFFWWGGISLIELLKCFVRCMHKTEGEDFENCSY